MFKKQTKDINKISFVFGSFYGITIRFSTLLLTFCFGIRNMTEPISILKKVGIDLFLIFQANLCVPKMLAYLIKSRVSGFPTFTNLSIILEILTLLSYRISGRFSINLEKRKFQS